MERGIVQFLQKNFNPLLFKWLIMDFTGERFIPLKELMDDEIAFEHLHRYYNAVNLVEDKIVLDIACGEGYGTAILSAQSK